MSASPWIRSLSQWLFTFLRNILTVLLSTDTLLRLHQSSWPTVSVAICPVVYWHLLRMTECPAVQMLSSMHSLKVTLSLALQFVAVQLSTPVLMLVRPRLLSLIIRQRFAILNLIATICPPVIPIKSSPTERVQVVLYLLYSAPPVMLQSMSLISKRLARPTKVITSSLLVFIVR